MTVHWTDIVGLCWLTLSNLSLPLSASNAIYFMIFIEFIDGNRA